MKVLFSILLVCIVILWSLRETIWLRIDAKSWYLRQASRSMTFHSIEKLYKHYGEAKATEFLIAELIARMRPVKEALYRERLDGEDFSSFKKELDKFATLMGSAILDLRAAGIAEEVFPLLRVLVRRLLLFEPEKLKETVIVRVPLFTHAEENEFDNPIVETFRWALDELEDTNPASVVSFPPIPFTYTVKRPKRTPGDST